MGQVNPHAGPLLALPTDGYADLALPMGGALTLSWVTDWLASLPEAFSLPTLASPPQLHRSLLSTLLSFEHLCI